jgi:chemotaxis protein histidine kinase CheA|tara:strand:- start:2035 stop:4215 length:2181 start_codon:yes stop_codon:yes gene_type:complete
MTQTLCITGALAPELNAISTPLYQAGLATAAPIERETRIDMHTWHQRAKPAFVEQRPLGKLWENVANDLLLANLDKPCWGWHDTDSIWAMPFWAEQEPNTHFLLVATRPEYQLAQSLLDDTPGKLDISALLTHWQHHHQRLLDFYLANPERCLVVDAEQAQQHPQALVELLAQRWQLPLDAHGIAEPTTAPNQPDALALYLAQQLIEQHLLTQQDKGFQTLHAELQAAQHPLVNNPPEPAQAASLEAIVLHYQQLNNQQQNDQRQLESDAQQIEALNQSADQLTQQLQQTQHALSKAEQQHQAEQHQQQQALDDLKQESELLLLQLHQVQEELESTFLKHQQLESLYQTLESQHKHTQQQLTQAQEQLKQTQEKLKQAEQQRDAAKQHETTQRQQQAELEDTKQENELLLLQLHQVQEELEHYFLEHQKLSSTHETLENRWQRLLKRHPDYCDYQTLDTHEDPQQPDTLQWHFQGLEFAGQHWPTLQIRSTLNAQGVVLTLHQPDAAPFKVGIPKSAQERRYLQSLSSRQWQYAQHLPKLLVQGLQDAELSTELKTRYQQALNALAESLASLPALLRVDDVNLHNVQVNPDYEHLWLELVNPTWGNEQLETWHLRLSTAGVTPTQFGAYPKLEIPAQPTPWLENWYAESQDDHGSKWELRFAQPDTLDMGAWQQLTPRDQTLLTQVLEQLPMLLNHLQEQGQEPGRGWQAWLQLVSDMQRIHQVTQ